MSLLPSRPDITTDGEPRVVGLDSEEADDLMSVLSSTTARRLVSELHEEPAPPAELATRLDTTLQNTQYHLENLSDAGVIEVVGTAYSEKGREMNVYGPTDEPLVIFAGDQARTPGLRDVISDLFGWMLGLAVVSLVVQQLFGTSLLEVGSGDDVAPASTTDGGGDVGTAATDTPAPTAEPTVEDSADGGDVNIAETGTDTPTPEAEPTPVPESTPGPEHTPTSESTPVPEPEPTTTPTDTPFAEPTVNPTETPMPTDIPAETPVADALDPGLDALLATGLPPGLAFFLGGSLILVAVVALQYR